jgi:hypothetical protein
VAYRPVVKNWLCKQRPFLGNGSVNTFPRQRIARNNRVIVGNGVFSMWSVPRCYRQGAKSVESQFCTGGCEERTWAREAVEFPILEAVARERLVKTWQTGKMLSGAVVVCKLWRLAVAL